MEISTNGESRSFRRVLQNVRKGYFFMVFLIGNSQGKGNTIGEKEKS